jgi:hypothetical protein
MVVVVVVVVVVVLQFNYLFICVLPQQLRGQF